MIYSSLRFLLRIAVRIFFKSIHITDKENIPAKGPLIIVANHPNTFMDPIIIATILNRKIFFLAKGGLFKSGFAKWLLPKFNMIPVYRKQDEAGDLHKNEDTFDKCYEHLENNGVILIFPEGTSITERKLREIKTGAARIALGAEAKNDFRLGVKILQIGLNYSNPQFFKSDLFVKIDQPTDVRAYANEYKIDPFKTALQLTEQIKTRLEEHIINIENNYLDSLLANIETIYKIKLARELGFSLKEKEEDFILTKNIAERLHYFYESDPLRVSLLDEKMSRYLNALHKLGIPDAIMRKDYRNNSFLKNNTLSLLYLIAGFPFYLYGLINNYLPYRIPGLIARKISREREYYAPIAMVTGIFTFLIFYSLQIYLVTKYFHRLPLTLAYFISLPLSGYFTYSYYYSAKYIRAKWLFISLFFSRSTLMANLIQQRLEIIKELDSAKTEYTSENSPFITGKPSH
jgi:glycerol-3-phosphate O-acyltransferase/dihydroxyacetone phosphate acyltransferase